MFLQRSLQNGTYFRDAPSELADALPQTGQDCLRIIVPVEQIGSGNPEPTARLLLLFQGSETDISVLDRIIVTGESEEPTGPCFPRVRSITHEFRDIGKVSVEDHVSVELDLDRASTDRHFLEVPLSGRSQESPFGSNHSVG